MDYWANGLTDKQTRVRFSSLLAVSSIAQIRNIVKCDPGATGAYIVSPPNTVCVTIIPCKFCLDVYYHYYHSPQRYY